MKEQPEPISAGVAVDALEELDRGYQRCFEICENMPDDLKVRAGKKGLVQLDSEDFRSILNPVTNDVYLVMAKTLFRVLQLLQPDDFRNARPLNFYFRPGYRSDLLNRRLYYLDSAVDDSKKSEGRYRGEFQNTGVGLCADDALDPNRLVPYHHCSSARWHHYATRPSKSFSSGSVFWWVINQEPSVSGNKYDLIHSLKITLIPNGSNEDDLADSAPARYQILRLNPSNAVDSSWAWGEQLARKLNEMTSYVNHPKARFGRDLLWPESFEHDRNHLKVRLWLQSLWLHAAFVDAEPGWLGDLETELRAHSIQVFLERLEQAKADPIAQDWGNRVSRRPRFVDWTLITLPPSPAPASAALSRWSTGEPRSVGSAQLLSSVVLRTHFISLVRPWIRAIYGIIRASESLMSAHNKNLETGKNLALIAGPWIGHEIGGYLRKNTAVRQRMADCSPEAVRMRRVAWDTVHSLADLAFYSTKAVLTQDGNQIADLRQRFLAPLEKLRTTSLLESALQHVAREAYAEANRREKTGKGRIPALESPSESDAALVPEVPPAGLAACFLLVNEMIVNFCRHTESDGVTGRFEITFGGSVLNIRLEAAADKEQLPESLSFRNLNTFLATVGLGGAQTTWQDSHSRKSYCCQVTLTFPAETT